MTQKAMRAQRRYVLAGALALLLALAAVAWTQWRQHRLLDTTIQYQNDFLQISLAQLQLEYLRLHGALRHRDDCRQAIGQRARGRALRGQRSAQPGGTVLGPRRQR